MIEADQLQRQTCLRYHRPGDLTAAQAGRFVFRRRHFHRSMVGSCQLYCASQLAGGAELCASRGVSGYVAD